MIERYMSAEVYQPKLSMTQAEYEGIYIGPLPRIDGSHLMSKARREQPAQGDLQQRDLAKARQDKPL
jgi:hypothetical protein